MSPEATSPPRSTAYRMADRLLDGKLAEVLAEGRSAGRSFEEISRRLFADHGIEAPSQTLRSWARQLGIELPPARRAVG